jgi:glycosyltransferase involved in cell wall biosynthesis
VFALRRLMRRERVGLVHARGYLPMEIGANAAIGTSTPLLFDIRGLQAEEYVDGGVWKEGELKWRLAKRSERRFFRKAAGAVVLTEAIKPYVQDRFAESRSAAQAPPIAVIPCCVDLDRFTFDAEARTRLRAKLGVSDDTVVFVYSGSLGTWYLSDAMARLVRIFGEKTGRKVFLLWTVNNEQELARGASERAGLAKSEYEITSAPAETITEWLSAGDVGLALIKPCFSKKSSSPTKYAEYLAVGMPVVISRDVGDGAVLEREGGAVALGDSLDDEALTAAALALAPMVGAPRARYRAVAQKLFDVDGVALPVYRDLYGRLIGH